MTLESVPLLHVRRRVEVLDCVAAKAEQRGVELVCDVVGPLLSDGVVLSDPGRFRQVFQNLIGNAVKFTPSGYVVVRAKVSLLPPASPPSSLVTIVNPVIVIVNPTSQLKLCVEVEDSGEGIPPDRIDTLFHAFTQADTSISRTHGGTGLGLAICSKLVELMGGSIGVKSQLGQGSTFSFSLLVEVEDAVVDQLRREEEEGGGGRKSDGGSIPGIGVGRRDSSSVVIVVDEETERRGGEVATFDC